MCFVGIVFAVNSVGRESPNCFGSSRHTLRPQRRRTGQVDVTQLPLKLAPPSKCMNVSDKILGRAIQNYSRVQDGTNIRVSDLAYADGLVLLTNNY